MVVFDEGKFLVYSEDGGKILGSFLTRAQAMAVDKELKRINELKRKKAAIKK